ncbi:Alpha/Beta hydrolase protein [Chytriomyces sp. MP71]|nr:Alpha/Beta hydrolase protein [Chytriomyces sp. MP71]
MFWKGAEAEPEPDSLMRFTSSIEKLGHCEEMLLKRHVSTPFKRHLVQPKGKDWAINTVVFNGPTDPRHVVYTDRSTLVITHGYGSGLGFFYPNYDHFASLRDRQGRPVQVVTIDWLGMGRSSRPLFAKRTRSNEDKHSNEALIQQAEDYFVNSLESWRQELGLTKFALAGHSLGGYLSGCYALKHHQHLTSLTLVSPFGMPSHPPNSTPLGNVSKDLSFAQRFFFNAWTNNYTPQWLLRGLGPYGMRLASRVVSGRFPQMDENDQRLVADYVFHLSTVRPAAGEYALNALMELRMVPHAPATHYEDLKEQVSNAERRRQNPAGTFGLFARHPIGVRLLDLPKTLPINVIYGDNDWMFSNRKSILSLDVVSDRRASKLAVIEGAGHHLYLDNAQQFFQVVKESRLWG